MSPQPATSGRNTLANLIAARVREAVGGALSDRQSELDALAKDAAASGLGTLVDEASAGAGGLAGVLGELPGIGPLVRLVEPLTGRVGRLIEGVAVGWALGTALYPTIRAFVLPIEHAVQDALTNEIWDPTTVAALLARGLIEQGHADSEAAGSGFDADHLSHLVALAETRPDVGMALELLRRGALDDTFVRGELRHLGYSAQSVHALLQLQRVLLSPADLALARLRGNIDDAAMQAYAKQLGVDPADMELLVENTGEPPGLEQLLFAFRRNFIDRSRLERGIRQSRVRNEWIDVVEKLRFAPMSIADSVRAVIENYLTEAEGLAIAQQNGLEPEHYHTLVQSYGRPLAHEQMGSLFHRGLASRAQFDQAMRESDIKDKYIGLSFDLTRRLLPERLIVQAIHFSAISLKDGARMLLELGYDQQTTGILLKLGLHEQHKPQHDLTRAELTSLYRDGVLSRADAEKHLLALGFSAQNAGYILTLSDTQQHAKELRSEQAATRNSYLANGIDRVRAEAELRQLGMTQTQAEHLIGVWDREKHRAARTLTETQIVKAAKAATIHPDEAITLLEAIGYSRANAAVLLNSNGVPVTA